MLDLPFELPVGWAKVELTVTPEKKESVSDTKSAFGCLQQFADPVKIPEEKGAWMQAVVYVLTGHYKVDRRIVSVELERFFMQTKCTLPHKEAVLQAFKFFGQTSLDSWRGFHTPPLWGGYKGMKPESNTFQEQPYPVRSAAGLVDFVDCILAGYAKIEKAKIYTFDNKLKKLIAE